MLPHRRLPFPTFRAAVNASRRGPVAFAALILAAGLAAPMAGEVPPEDPGPLPVEQTLTPEEISGPDWTVEPTATTDGFSITYTVDSRFGKWPAITRVGLAQRIREIQALAQLDEISQSEVFLDAVQKSVVSQLELVKEFSERPGETVKAVPASVGRWFRKTSFRVRETYEDAKDEIDEVRSEAKADETSGGTSSLGATGDEVEGVVREEVMDYLKISGAERAWYARLQVDPSTDNEVLRRAVKKVARVDGLTSFGMKFAGLPAIPGASELSDVMELVWENDPWELRRVHFERMVKAGLSKETVRAFQDNRELSLTIQTALLRALERLEGVAGRASIIARAIEVESKTSAEALLGSTVLLAQLHQTTSPLEEILADTRLPVARARDGALVTAVAREALYWTAPVKESAEGFAAVYADVEASERVFWMTGEASERFREGIGELGWSLRDRLDVSTLRGGESE